MREQLFTVTGEARSSGQEKTEQLFTARSEKKDNGQEKKEGTAR
jgi:hypothetical protein